MNGSAVCQSVSVFSPPSGVVVVSKKGTYTLVLEVTRDVTVEIGALGTHTLSAGWYAYTGSAFGSGGFSRVDRHRELAAGDRTVRHWHVDYLLGHEATHLREVVTTPGVDVECAVARALPEGPVTGFGASDCACRSHLSRLETTPVAAVERAHRKAR
jgi:endonuclease-3